MFNAEEIGGLKPLVSFVLFIVSNYFVIITLIMISYVPPNEMTYFHIYSKVIITPLIVILFLMLLLGIVLFITTQKTVRNLIDKDIKIELERINKNYKETYEKVIDIYSKKMTTDSKNELEGLRITLDILEKEEMKIRQIKEKIFDIKTITAFITTVLLPTMTLIKQIMDLSVAHH